ncbi:MAG: FMN-binding negative transcriptional regulator [Burkholderiaceae bacterium]
MYLNPSHSSTDAAVAAQIVREQPLASLITTDDDGLPQVSHLPMHLVVDDQGAWTLLAHMARANPQWRQLQARPQALVTFLGPNAYMSPAVYVDPARVPTWSYVAVHCRVRARLIDPQDLAAKDELLKALIGDHEPAYAMQWRSLDAAFQQRMLSAIVAFELAVESWQCAVKLNQHRPEAHTAMHDRYARGTGAEPALARWMEQLGMVPATRQGA